jgi:proline iminopeptidase
MKHKITGGGHIVKKNRWFFSNFPVVVCMLIFIISSCGQEKVDFVLWPEIEPFETDYLKVSPIHELYYELCGNPDGKPVVVLHGGPGGGSSPLYRRFFNPEKFLIVQYDQRGSGKSRPYADIRENTTQHLVEDIETLRQHLNLDKVLIFGGSWGSTLGIAYGETYPESVSGMILRGIFTGAQDEIDHFYHGGVRPFFPETYETLEMSVEESERKSIHRALLKRVESDDPAVRDKYAMIWAKYEYKVGMLYTDDEIMAEVEQTDPEVFLAFAVMENYYMANGCFLEEGQLLREAGKIADIPIVLVNGRYDMICPPINAYRLHKLLPKSKLVIAEEAGHWLGDRPVERALLEAVQTFE